ncbi:MAG: alpha/beta hydrolase family protein [Bacteroidales bacterium]
MGLLACSLLLQPATAAPALRRGVTAPDRRPDVGYKIGPGPWPVAVTERLVLKDQRRRRSVEVSVRYPGGKGTRKHPPFPLVVFSPDDKGSRLDVPDLLSHWASHGYVVVAPLPEDERPRTPHADRVPFDARQLDRLADVTFVLDSLDQLEKRMDGFHGRHATQIARDRIGISGYAAGALTAQMAIGVKVRVSKPAGEVELRSVGDPRIKAAVLLSPQGTVNRMLTRDSWTDLVRPMLVVTGSRDVVAASRETPESREEPFTLAKPGQKFLLFIEGATHTSYSLLQDARADAAAAGPPLPEGDARLIAGATAAVTLAFWDGYLQGDERGRDYLASDDITRFSGGKAQLRRR